MQLGFVVSHASKHGPNSQLEHGELQASCGLHGIPAFAHALAHAGVHLPSLLLCLSNHPQPCSQVIADNEAGLLFKNKRDRKVINVDPRLKPGDNSTRTELTTSEFLQVSFGLVLCN